MLLTDLTRAIFSRILPTGATRQLPMLTAPKLYDATQSRGMKKEVFYHNRGTFANDEAPRGNHYTPSVTKRIKKHGLMTRLQSRGGKQILWKKLIKGPGSWVKLTVAP